MDRVFRSYSESRLMIQKLKNKIKFLTENLYKYIRSNELVDAYIDFDIKEVYFRTNEHSFKIRVSKNGYNVRIEEDDCFEDFSFFNYFEIFENTNPDHPLYKKLEKVLEEVDLYIPDKVNFINVKGLFFDICFTNPINMYFTSISENRFIYYRKKGEIIEHIINNGGRKDISIIPFPLVSIRVLKRTKQLNTIIEELKLDNILSKNHKISKINKMLLIYLY